MTLPSSFAGVDPPSDAGSSKSVRSEESIGMFLGFLGVAMFSVSFPVTRVAVREFGVMFVSFGRAVVAGCLGLAGLLLTRSPRPQRAQVRRLALVVAGVIIGFPALIGFALQKAPAGHGSVVIGLLPAITAGLAVVRAGDRPSPRYWLFAALGGLAIVVLAVARGTRDVAVGDLLLVGAACFSAVGYTEGALLSRDLGGWQTISWALVFGLPLTVPLMLIGLGPVQGNEPITAWASFAYLGCVSMFVGFFAWYAGLARGGIARVSQIQLVQPLLSLVWATIFLHERLDLLTVVVAGVVLFSVAGSRRSAIGQAAPR